MPSIWYETFGRTIIEAFAAGTPVVASDMGAMSELVTPGETGQLFSPNNAGELARCVAQFHSDGASLPPMRQRCRREYERRYTPQSNYQMLLDIYERALQASSD
jgi:glycosyltransferase involved in cell wall biosynthesis